MTVAAPINPFMSREQKMTHILRVRVRATVARAYASSSCVCRSSSERPRNLCSRPLVRKLIVVCATTTIKAVIPAHEVTLREMTFRLNSTLCFFTVAMRMLSKAPWTDPMISPDVRQAAMVAISCGWFVKSENFTKYPFTRAELALAAGAYQGLLVPTIPDDTTVALLHCCTTYNY